MNIPLSKIKPSPRPVRTSWDEDALNELAQSIKEQGVIVPIKVRPDDGGYEIVYGHRRVEAARRTKKLTDIPAFVEGMEDTPMLIQALIENLHREDLHPLDKAHALKVLKEETGWNNMEIERQGIMPNQMVSYLLALLDESEEVQALLSRGTAQRRTTPGTITEFHVRGVREAGTGSHVAGDVLKKAAEEGLTAAQTKRIAESVAVAKSGIRKKFLLNTPYSPMVHDAAEVEAREAAYGDHDPALRPKPAKAKRAEEPEVSWEVKRVVEYIKAWEGDLQQFKQTVKVGKMSPEGKQYIAHRLRGFITSLEEFIIKELEDGD